MPNLSVSLWMLSMLGVGVGFDTKGAGEIIVKGVDDRKTTAPL